jgi:hypothetical protein
MLRLLLGKFSVSSLLGGIVGQAAGVIRNEIDTARRDFNRKIKALAAGIGLLVVGGAFAFLVIGLTVLAALDGLSNIWPLWLSALVIAGVFLIVAVIFIAVGLKRIRKNSDLRPERVVSAVSAYRRFTGSAE